MPLLNQNIANSFEQEIYDLADENEFMYGMVDDSTPPPKDLPENKYEAPTRYQNANKSRMKPNPGEEENFYSFPIYSDRKIGDIKDLAPFTDRVAVGLITEGRRESGSVLRLRNVFYKS